MCFIFSGCGCRCFVFSVSTTLPKVQYVPPLAPTGPWRQPLAPLKATQARQHRGEGRGKALLYLFVSVLDEAGRVLLEQGQCELC